MKRVQLLTYPETIALILPLSTLLSLYLVKVLSFDPELCVGCGVCEETCSETWFKVADREKSSIRIDDDGEGDLSAAVCIQCGECEPKCPIDVPIIDQLEEVKDILG